MKVQRAYDIDSGVHVFSVTAKGKKFSYIFADSKSQIFDPKKRVKMILDKVKVSTDDMSEDKLIELAKLGLTQFKYGPMIEADDANIATAREKLSIKQSRKDFIKSQEEKQDYLAQAAERIYDTLQDFPELENALWEDEEGNIPSKGMFELVMAAVGEIDPNGPNAWLIDYMDGKEKDKDNPMEIVLSPISPVTAAVSPQECPPATRDIQLNLKNRQNAIDNIGYGPLNPNESNEEFWQEKANRWNVSIEDAKTSRCGNCAAFIRTTKMLECISQGLQEGDKNVEDSYDVIVAGELGYCEALDFKCAASRTCDAWIAGGPVTDETRKEEKSE